MATAETQTEWAMKGRGYEFCNCDLGCGCNFGGFPNSDDGSCRALVGVEIDSGKVGNVDVSGLKCAALINWPQAIHEGNGKCVFVVEPSTSDEQIEALSQVFTGALGGMPWEILGGTFEVVGLQKTHITVEGEGLRSRFIVEGIGEGRGECLKNPVTGEDHQAIIHLPTGFIWSRGECGVGSYHASSDGIEIGADNSNWILYEFDWTNRAA